MRKYKFRGYSKRLKSWLYGSLVYANKKYYILPNSNDENIIKIKKYNRHLLVQAKEENRLVAPESIGEYTGLKDKDGKEIYEGDIVGVVNQINKIDFKRIVRFDEGMFGIEDEFGGFQPLFAYVIDDFDKGSHFCLKLGNIYENPELLEQG